MKFIVHIASQVNGNPQFAFVSGKDVNAVIKTVAKDIARTSEYSTSYIMKHDPIIADMKNKLYQLDSGKDLDYKIQRVMFGGDWHYTVSGHTNLTLEKALEKDSKKFEMFRGTFVKSLSDAILDWHVKDGDLTQEEADAIKKQSELHEGQQIG